MLPHIRSGRIKAYAVLSKERWSAAPDIPTADEAGVPGINIAMWTGLWAPKRHAEGHRREAQRGRRARRWPTRRRGSGSPRPASIFRRAGQLDAGRRSPPTIRSETEKWWPIIKACEHQSRVTGRIIMNIQNTKKTQVAIMNAVHDLPVLVARDQGFFKDEGLDIEFVTTPGMAQVTTSHLVKFDSIFDRPLDSVYNEGGIDQYRMCEWGIMKRAVEANASGLRGRKIVALGASMSKFAIVVAPRLQDLRARDAQGQGRSRPRRTTARTSPR